MKDAIPKSPATTIAFRAGITKAFRGAGTTPAADLTAGWTSELFCAVVNAFPVCRL
jgi:hypothetical protein